MHIDWDFAAQSYLDQLPQAERSKVLHAVETLPATWDSLDGGRLNRLAGDQDDLYALRVGADLRVILRRQDDRLVVVDIIRRSQVDGLRRLALGQAMPG